MTFLYSYTGFILDRHVLLLVLAPKRSYDSQSTIYSALH